MVEMGAGNGQWSRVLRSPPYSCDVLSFDDMSALPLNPSLYHNRTEPNNKYFDYKLRKGDEKIFHKKYGSQFEMLRGRALMVVFPERGTTMRNFLEAWKSMSSENRYLIYVGEGRGGANSDDSFFDEIEGGGWKLLTVKNVKSFGTKGFEKLFVLERVTSALPAANKIS